MTCGFYHDGDGRYYCSIDLGSSNRPPNIYYARMEFWGDSSDQHILDVWPCDFNYTPNEIKEHLKNTTI
jgi:hypothetical protein